MIPEWVSMLEGELGIAYSFGVGPGGEKQVEFCLPPGSEPATSRLRLLIQRRGDADFSIQIAGGAYKFAFKNVCDLKASRGEVWWRADDVNFMLDIESELLWYVSYPN